MSDFKHFIQVKELEDGRVIVHNPNKRQMARWYALDYFVDKPELDATGYYKAQVAEDFLFSPGFRKIK